MENFVGGLILLVVILSVMESHEKDTPQTEREKYVNSVINGERSARDARQVDLHGIGVRRTRSTAPRSVSIRTDASASSVEMIRQTAQAFDVPAGQLFGHWTAESGRLEGPYGRGPDWLTADELGRGECASRYPRAIKRCVESARILQAICAQHKRDGSRVCDTSSVKLSVAYAMGPMQLMPNTIAFLRPDGSIGWTKVAVDADGDGVIDPFSRADAFASAAQLIRMGYDRHGNWLGAIDRYYGAPKAGYRRNVVRGWSEWCSIYGCSSASEMVAER